MLEQYHSAPRISGVGTKASRSGAWLAHMVVRGGYLGWVDVHILVEC